MTNRRFWATIRPFLTNKGMTTSNDISLKQGNDVKIMKEKLQNFRTTPT